MRLIPVGKEGNILVAVTEEETSVKPEESIYSTNLKFHDDGKIVQNNGTILIPLHGEDADWVEIAKILSFRKGPYLLTYRDQYKQKAIQAVWRISQHLKTNQSPDDFAKIWGLKESSFLEPSSSSFWNKTTPSKVQTYASN